MILFLIHRFVSFDCVSNPLLFPPFHPRPLGAHNLTMIVIMIVLYYIRKKLLFRLFLPEIPPYP